MVAKVPSWEILEFITCSMRIGRCQLPLYTQYQKTPSSTLGCVCVGGELSAPELKHFFVNWCLTSPRVRREPEWGLEWNLGRTGRNSEAARRGPEGSPQRFRWGPPKKDFFFYYNPYYKYFKNGPAKGYPFDGPRTPILGPASVPQ